MTKITVRRAEQSDIEALQANYPRPELPIGQRRFDEMAEGKGVFAVAEVDGELAASGFLDFADEQMEPEVKNLWVFPAFRRMGAGQALWTWLEERAAEAGYKQVFLSVSPENESAISLFLQLGYSPTGDHHTIENPEDHAVSDPDHLATHYAIYQKSLQAN